MIPALPTAPVPRFAMAAYTPSETTFNSKQFDDRFGVIVISLLLSCPDSPSSYPTPYMEAMKRSGLSAASDGVLSKRTGAAPTGRERIRQASHATMVLTGAKWSAYRDKMNKEAKYS